MYKKLIGDVNAYYMKLFSVGWLDEWNDEEVTLLGNALKDTAAQDPELMVFCLSEYILNPEGINTPAAYGKTLKDLFSAFGINLPEHKITKEGDTVCLQIQTPMGELSGEIEQEDEWLSEDFMDFLNEDLLPAIGEKRIFYPLPPVDAVLEIVYQYPEVIDAALDAGIIPEDDFFIED